MKKIIPIISFILSQQLMAQNQSVKLNLRNCIETAIAYNLQVRQTAYQLATDKASLQQAKASRLPSLNGNIGHGINQGRSIDPFTNSYVNSEIAQANYGINSSVTLWNGSAINHSIKQNELNVQASEMSWQQEKDNVTINVILAYLQVLSNKEQLSIAEKQVAITKGQVERLIVLNNSGAIAPATLYDLQGQLGSDQLSLLSIKNSLETAKISLAQLMNQAYSPDMDLEPLETNGNAVLYDAGADEIFKTATQQLAMIKAAEFRQKSAQKSVLTARALLLPTLSLNGGLGTNYSSVASRQLFLGSSDVATAQYVTVNNTKIPVFAPQSNFSSQKISYGDQWKNNFNSSISINLQIPILNRLQGKTRIKQAQITEQRAAFETESIKTQVHRAVDQAYINMQTSLERYKTLEKQVADFTASFKAAEVRFNAGVNTVVEYMLAKNNVDRANANFIAAKYDYILRMKLLDFYQGKALW
ncbi:TolC family protein [Sediminibacterium goheungense]|uniref:Outer membrane protein n=1 Tax=Sediminibacterium goheungense TaxID=1086393 RepID=A0A4R6IZB7_9BACT|nr:TolC family protein [Sediminibacterium goheungense]TDO28210.1 outer membrane protein [Sediminibacterium goheungense]